MSIGPIGRGAPSVSLPNLGMPGGGAPAFARAGGSPFAKDSFEPAAAGAAKGGGMEQLVGQLQQVVQALGKIVDMLKQMVGGAQQAGGGAPGGGGAPEAGGAPGGGAPGGGGGAPGGAEGAAKPSATPPAGGDKDPSRGPTGESPLEIARSMLGQNAADMKTKGRLAEEMEDWVPNNVNCANFVSAVLEEAGQINKSQHSASVANLRTNLEKSGNFQKTSIENAKPGDVVMMNTGGKDDNAHVVIFAGMKDGKPTFIGSNNANPDGSQKVTEVPMNYKITGVYSYTG